MNIRKVIDLIKPEAGYDPLRKKYLRLSGIAFVAVFIAEALDRLEPAPYAAYYVGAINEAVSPRFWDLLSVSGLMFLGISIPFIYVSKFISQFTIPANCLRYITHSFFLLAFDIGAIALGILIAQFIQFMDSPYLLAWESLLFSGANFFLLLELAVLNSLLWVAGESIYNRDSQHCSGLLAKLIDQPGLYGWSAYGVFAAGVVYLVVSQQ